MILLRTIQIVEVIGVETVRRHAEAAQHDPVSAADSALLAGLCAFVLHHAMSR